jgi:dienelactone hydrolase
MPFSTPTICFKRPLPSRAHNRPDTTGPQTSTRALITIYDIFGIAPQTLQGADALATALNCLVIMPDFFEGGKAEGEWFSNPYCFPLPAPSYFHFQKFLGQDNRANEETGVMRTMPRKMNS